MSDVTGFFFSNATPAFASAQVIFWISWNHTPTPGRPNSIVKPTSPSLTRPLTSLVFTSSVPRPCTPVDSCGTRGSENARRTTRGHCQFLGLESGGGADIGFGIEAQPHHLEQSSAGCAPESGLRCSWLRPLKQA